MPSGEFFFTKTKKKQKNVDLASHPRTNIKQYIQVSGCYRRGGRGWVALFLVARLSSPVPCVKPGGEFSPSRRTALFLSTSRVGHGMEAGQQWENVKSLPLWDPSCPETWGKGGVEQGEDGGGGKGVGASERLVMPHREIPFRCGGARRALVHALGAGALVLLFGACAGRDGGRGRGGGAGLLLKVCYDHRHVPYGDSQLLGGAPVNVLQFGPEGHRREKERKKNVNNQKWQPQYVRLCNNKVEAASTVGAVTLNCSIHRVTHEQSEQVYIK